MYLQRLIISLAILIVGVGCVTAGQLNSSGYLSTPFGTSYEYFESTIDIDFPMTPGTTQAVELRSTFPDIDFGPSGFNMLSATAYLTAFGDVNNTEFLMVHQSDNVGSYGYQYFVGTGFSTGLPVIEYGSFAFDTPTTDRAWAPIEDASYLSAATVPEPGTAIMSLAALAACILRRGSRR